MKFRDQSIGAFLEAKSAATAIMRDEVGIISRAVSLEEALIMQACGSSLDGQDSFGAADVNALVPIGHPTVYRALKRFDEEFGLISRVKERRSPGVLPSTTCIPTELGGRVFGLFYRDAGGYLYSPEEVVGEDLAVVDGEDRLVSD